MKPFLTLALAGSLAGVASAATITQIQTYAFVPSGNQVLTFDRFDTTLGTLTGVTVSVSLNKTGGRYEVDNDSETAGTIDLSHKVTANLAASGVSLSTGALTPNVGVSGSLTATNELTNQAISATTGDDTLAFNNTGAGDYLLFEPGDSTASDSGDIRSGDISTYEGTDTFTMTLNALQSVDVTGLSGLQQSFTVSNISGDVTVVYNYEAIPEPASALLGGLGFIALLRRRRH